MNDDKRGCRIEITDGYRAHGKERWGWRWTREWEISFKHLIHSFPKTFTASPCDRLVIWFTVHNDIRQSGLPKINIHSWWGTDDALRRLLDDPLLRQKELLHSNKEMIIESVKRTTDADECVLKSSGRRDDDQLRRNCKKGKKSLPH